MKFIITETQKKQLIKYHLHEDDKVEDKVEDKVGDKVDDKSENDLTGTTVGSIMTKVIDYVKKSLQNDTKGSSSNSKGSGNLGNIKLTGSFGGDAKNNISLLIDAMKDKGITDPLTQIGILSVIKKESNFIPKGEVSYAGTDNSRIRSIFGSRVRNFTDEQLNRLKTNAKQFFNTVYANTVGNLAGDDGWNFRGRGFNQLTKYNMNFPDGEHLIEGKIYVVKDGQVVEIKEVEKEEVEMAAEEVAEETTEEVAMETHPRVSIKIE